MMQNTQINRHQLGRLIGANKGDGFYELHYASGEIARLYILSDGIFRLLIDPSKKYNSTDSLVDLSKFDQTSFKNSTPRATSDSFIIKAGNYQIIFDQKAATMSIFDEVLHRNRLRQISPIELDQKSSYEFLKQNKNEFYFGGGIQNGAFSHKGEAITIQTDGITGTGGVLSQVPFFWSNAGFGELRNTTSKGIYDFGKLHANSTIIEHQSPIFDNFYLLANSPQEILAKYYSLTGTPLMPPKYAMSLGHLGNFIDTNWQASQAKDRKACQFENGGYYARTNNPEITSYKASLNGEEEYQFSARAMIDRYQKQHFKLGWLVANYDQNKLDPTSSSNLNEYAALHGVEAGIWTNSLTPDITKGTSFILNHKANKETLLKENKDLQNTLNRKRSFVLTDRGFAGSQSLAAIIFGESGGTWDNIASQIRTLLGANLSGEALTGISVDGKNGGGNAQIAVRDFEWKALTPLLFNLDDQSPFSKTPFTYNSKITAINHAYLSLREKLESYLYTLLHNMQKGGLIVSPLFMEFPHEQINYTDQVGHEFMLGPNLLVAPITNGREDENSDSLKDNVYLPSHRTMWIDLFSGQKFLGGRVYNELSYPTWHLPVFVRGGAIFDIGKRNFVFYPQNSSTACFYDDNNYSDFAHNQTKTKVESNLQNNQLTITLHPVEGEYSGMEVNQATQLNIMCDSYPDRISVKVNDQLIDLQEYGAKEAFDHAKEGIFYNTQYSWLEEFDRYRESKMQALQIKLGKHVITQDEIKVIIQNFNYGNRTLVHSITDSVLHSPKAIQVDPAKISAHSIQVSWANLAPKVQFEINGILYDGITGSSFTFHELKPDTRYTMRMRYANGNKVSEWSEIFTCKTKKAALAYAVKNIKVSSNYLADEKHPLTYLTDLKPASEWQTKDKFDPAKPLTLTFNFEDVEDLSRMTFIPHNIDTNMTPTLISLETSKDGLNFEPYQAKITWRKDSKNKVIGLRDVKARAIRLTIHQSSGDKVASKGIIFFKPKK